MRNKIPLSLAFTIPFTLQVLGIVSLVAYFSYRSGEKAVASIVNQLMTQTETLVTEELDSYLSLPHKINQLNITAVKSGVLCLDNLDQLHDYLIQQHQQLSELTSVLFGNNKGEFLTVHHIDDSAIETGVTKIDPTQDLPIEVGRSDLKNPSNLNLYALNKNQKIDRYLMTVHNIDVRERPWYRQAIETQKPGWSEPFQIGSTHLLAINAYAPFYNSFGELQGVFSINISLEKLNNFLESLSMGKTGQIFIVEQNGLLIANSTKDFAYDFSIASSRDIESTGSIQFRRIFAQNSSHHLIQKTTQILEQEFGNLKAIESSQELKTQIEINSKNNETYFIKVIPYQDDYGLDWLVVTVVPQSDFIEQITKNIEKTIILCSLALLGSMGFGVWSSRRLSRSLSALSQGSQNIAKGEFKYSLTASEIKEVNILSQSFSQMAYHLQEADRFRKNYQEILEQEVQNKTQALKEKQGEIQLISDSIPACIAYVDSALRYQFVNQTYQDWFGYSQEQFLGCEVKDIIGKEAYHEVLPYIQKALAGETVTYERELYYPNENYRYISAVLTPKFNDDNTVEGYYVLLTDLTPRKQLELELEKANQELEKLASIDGLTQIPNRRTFDQHLQEQWNRATQESFPLSLILCDVDYFKKYNDYYGHQKGDTCLQKVALILKETCEQSGDFPARYGGEEFAIICTGKDAATARDLGETIQKHLYQMAIPHAGNPNHDRVTLSMGVATQLPQQGNEPRHLLRTADQALYQAKQQGRDQIIIAENHQ